MDLQVKINEATTRLLAAQKERADREASAQAHEQAAREDRLAMTALKKEVESLNAVIRHAGVQKATEDAAASAEVSAKAAAKAQADAEQTLARLAEKEKALDAAIAKAKEPAKG